MARGGSFGDGSDEQHHAEGRRGQSSRSVTSSTGSMTVVACFAARCVPALMTVWPSSAHSTPRGSADGRLRRRRHGDRSAAGIPARNAWAREGLGRSVDRAPRPRTSPRRGASSSPQPHRRCRAPRHRFATHATAAGRRRPPPPSRHPLQRPAQRQRGGHIALTTPRARSRQPLQRPPRRLAHHVARPAAERARARSRAPASRTAPSA